MSRLISFALLVSARIAAAQTDCPRQLDWAADYAARNYAGFDDKVTPATSPAYIALLDSLRADAPRAASIAECDRALARWIAFFQDGHLTLSRPASPAPAVAAPSDAEVRARFASWDRVALDEATARARLTSLGAERDSIEGIWQLTDGRYRVAILRDGGGGYAMSTLAATDSVWWSAGQVKARLSADSAGTYTTRFFMRDHSEQRWTAAVRRNVLTLSSGMRWVREWPVRDGDVTLDAYRAQLNTRFAARELVPGTVLAQLPSFNDPQRIDSLFAAEGARIRSAERLVIDVRGNGGGSDYNYRELLPLMYTRPYRTLGIATRATEDNARATEKFLDDPDIADGQKPWIRTTVAQMRKHTGDGWWIGGDDQTRFDHVLARPSRVAVLVDRGCASSCEQFLLAAKQSDKVTLYGDRSAGVLDYANVRTAQFPGGGLTLHYPTTKSKRLPAQPVDGIGIAPDVRMPADELLPIEWVVKEMR